MANRRGLKICANQVKVGAPTLCVAAEGDTLLAALRYARHLAKVDLLPETGADEAAGVPDQRPAHRRRSLPVMMNVLFGDVRVVPDHFLLEAARRSVMRDLAYVCANNSFERL